jgi:hypothetical protein
MTLGAREPRSKIPLAERGEPDERCRGVTARQRLLAIATIPAAVGVGALIVDAVRAAQVEGRPFSGDLAWRCAEIPDRSSSHIQPLARPNC